MQITIKNGYVENFSLTGSLINGLEVSDPLPEEIEILEQYPSAFKLQDGIIVLDNSVLMEVQDHQFLTTLRLRREAECFPIINRGALWYEKLSANEKQELMDWYNAWLDVTISRIPPAMPGWIKRKEK